MSFYPRHRTEVEIVILFSLNIAKAFTLREVRQKKTVALPMFAKGSNNVFRFFLPFLSLSTNMSGVELFLRRFNAKLELSGFSCCFISKNNVSLRRN